MFCAAFRTDLPHCAGTTGTDTRPGHKQGGARMVAPQNFLPLVSI